MSVAGGVSMYRQRRQKERALGKKSDAADLHNASQRLLTLPGEIRNHIYGYLWGKGMVYKGSAGPTKDFNLNKTCRVLRAEGQRFLYGNNSFRLHYGALNWQYFPRQNATPRDIQYYKLPGASDDRQPNIIFRTNLADDKSTLNLVPEALLRHTQDLEVAYQMQVRNPFNCSYHIVMAALVLKGDTYSCRVWMECCHPNANFGCWHFMMAASRTIRIELHSTFKRKILALRTGLRWRQVQLVEDTERTSSSRYAKLFRDGKTKGLQRVLRM